MGLRDGLVAEYLFRGNAEDSSGQGRHGIVHGASLAPDRFGNASAAFRFDGEDDYIEVSPPPKLGSAAMSVSVWACFARRRLSGWTNCIVAQDDGVDEDQSRRVFQLSARNRHLIWHRMTRSRDPESKRWIRFGEWYHLAATVAEGRHTLYLDGVRQDEVTESFATHPAQPLHIGRKGTIEPYFFFKGTIDDLRLYDRALTPWEVLELYRENGFAKPGPVPLARDAIAGRWGQQGVNFLDLRLEGPGVVRGHVMNGRPERRADIVSGSFDPASGALRLEGTGEHQKTGARLPFVIEGLLDDGVVTVTAHFGDYSGTFELTRRGARGAWRWRLAGRLKRLIDRVLGLRRDDAEC